MNTWEKIESQLDNIREMARNGNTETEIIKYLKISRNTFYKYKKTKPELNQALLEGYTYSLQAVEAALYKSALGYEYDEITKERDKTGALVITKTVKKEVQPNVSACMNILTNRLPGKWQNQSKIDVSGKIEQENKAFDLLPSEDVSKLAKTLLGKDLESDSDD